VAVGGLVWHICFEEQDAELYGELVEEQAVEEGVVLLATGAEAQHLGEQFWGFLVGQWRDLVELLHPLNVCQLIRS
jgi:hypothetical protein